MTHDTISQPKQKQQYWSLMIVIVDWWLLLGTDVIVIGDWWLCRKHRLHHVVYDWPRNTRWCFSFIWQKSIYCLWFERVSYLEIRFSFLLSWSDAWKLGKLRFVFSLHSILSQNWVVLFNSEKTETVQNLNFRDYLYFLSLCKQKTTFLCFQQNFFGFFFN